MLFGSPLPHMPRSPLDTSAAHLSLSPHQNATLPGIFSPGALQSIFQSPSGATLDDSPFHSLSHPPAKHSPVSAAAQYSATQASRQASVGQAQAQRMEQQHNTAGAADTKDQTSAGMLVPVNAPMALMANKQVTNQTCMPIPCHAVTVVKGSCCDKYGKGPLCNAGALWHGRQHICGAHAIILLHGLWPTIKEAAMSQV